MKLWTKNFPNCAVAIKTACTAEDVLRAAKCESYDLIICDHHFNHDISNLKRIAPSGSKEAEQRPSLRCESDKTVPGATRHDVRSFFEKECFTIEENDGELLGLNALMQIAESSTLSNYSSPVLMLVSGHKIDVKAKLGIMVVQKPLKLSEFISSLEKHAIGLLRAGRLRHKKVPLDPSDKDNRTKDIIVNSNGCQLFERFNESAS